MKNKKKILVILIAIVAAIAFIAVGCRLYKGFVTDSIMDGGSGMENPLVSEQQESSKADTKEETELETEAEASNKKSITAVIKKDAKFDSADLNLSAEDFTNAGFALGDSLDIEFSNGETLTDVPYYNGYYAKTGNPVVVAYPNQDYVLIAKSNADLWTPLKLSDGMTVTLSLNTSAKYIAVQEALGQSYSVDRNDYSSDIEFVNFRALSGGKLKKDFLYRGASPVDNSRKRAAYANALIEKEGIACIIDLADSDKDMTRYFSEDDFSSDYAKKLYEDGKTVVLSMSSSYSKDEYKKSVVKGLKKLLEVGGPAYIHCMEGKDRTGFVCMLIEALAGASYDEMCDDYMTTYKNYYKITKEETPDRYEAVVNLYFDTFMEYLSGEEDPNTLHEISYVDSAKKYLKDGGMTEEEIDKLIAMITN